MTNKKLCASINSARTEVKTKSSLALLFQRRELKGKLPGMLFLFLPVVAGE
jgi:hypothetical protein